jgi:hypothetical protein
LVCPSGKKTTETPGTALPLIVTVPQVGKVFKSSRLVSELPQAVRHTNDRIQKNLTAMGFVSNEISGERSTGDNSAAD